jgi:hypothetical protein
LAVRQSLFPGIPVVFCGLNEFASQRFAGKGLAGFIQKPYQLSALESEFRRVLPSLES